jgi:signal transduction histidine kinase
VEAALASGLDAELTMSQPTAEVPAATALAAYRIVQEGVANAARHAPGAPVRVLVAQVGGLLRVDVTNGAMTGASA